MVRIKCDTISIFMNINALARVHLTAIPLYKAKQGSVYRCINHDGRTFQFRKHRDHEFPQALRLKRSKIIAYQYEVGIPDCEGAHEVIFVEETAIIELIEIP